MGGGAKLIRFRGVCWEDKYVRKDNYKDIKRILLKRTFPRNDMLHPISLKNETFYLSERLSILDFAIKCLSFTAQSEPTTKLATA